MSRGNMIDRDLFSLCGGGISCNVVCVWIVHLCTRFFFFFFTFLCTPMGLVYYSQDPYTLLFSNFFIKNRSHGTIHTFKNYFATVFFSFQLYPNRPLV